MCNRVYKVHNFSSFLDASEQGSAVNNNVFPVINAVYVGQCFPKNGPRIGPSIEKLKKVYNKLM